MVEFRVFVFSLDLKFSKLVTNRLSWFGFKAYPFKSFKNFWPKFYDFQPHLIVVDDSFIPKYVFAFLKELNNISNIPIIFLTKNNFDLYQICFFEINHFINKPFSINSLDLKVASIFNKNLTYSSFFELKSHNILCFHLQKKKIIFNKSLVVLTKIEFNIFSLILSQKNQKYFKSGFLKNVWDYADFSSLKSNILEMHFSKMKKKLKVFFKKPRFFTKIKNNFIFYY